MTVLETILLTVLSLIMIGAAGYLIWWKNKLAFIRGMTEMQQKMVSTFGEASQPGAQRQASFQSDMGSIIDKYDLVFDTELVSYFATGVAATAWPVILEDIQQAVLERESQIPQGTTTIIVRSFKMKRDGTGEYKLEPIVSMRPMSMS